LGRGDIYLSQELSLEPRERKTQTYAFEHGLVEKEESLPVVRPVVHTNGLPGCARAHRYVGIMPFGEGAVFVYTWFAYMGPPIS